MNKLTETYQNNVLYVIRYRENTGNVMRRVVERKKRGLRL